MIRTHILFYYAQEQIKRGEKVFDFSSSQGSTTSISESNSVDVRCLLKSINKFDPKYHFEEDSGDKGFGASRLKQSDVFKKKGDLGERYSGKTQMKSYLLIQSVSEMGIDNSGLEESRKFRLSRWFDVDVSKIEKDSILKGVNRVKSRSSLQRNSLKSKIKLETLEAFPSERSFTVLTTPSSKKDLLFRKGMRLILIEGACMVVLLGVS